MYYKKPNSFYESKPWRKKRSNVLKRDNYQCRECKRYGRTAQAEMVHHVFPLEDYPDYRLSNDNLLSCCQNCHNTFHDRNNNEVTEQGIYWQRKLRQKIGITEQQLIDTFRVVLVWGSPASGKTTYVKERMRLTDMVVDLDYIKQAISLQPKTSAMPKLINASLSIRSYIYDLISNRETIEADTVYVVAGLPKQTDRDYLIKKLKVNEVIHIDTDEQTCIQRATEDSDGLDKRLQVEIIMKHFRELET